LDCRFRSSLLLLVLRGALLGAASGGLELHSVDGEAVRLRPESADAPLVLHFWATWCPSCGEELGRLDAAGRDCLAAGVQVVAVNVGEDAATIRQYLESEGLALPVLRDTRGRVWRELSGVGLPLNVTWSDGERRVDFGPRNAETWRRVLSELGCTDPGAEAGADAPPPAVGAGPSAPAQTRIGTDS
jgi:peroxiredoxin